MDNDLKQKMESILVLDKVRVQMNKKGKQYRTNLVIRSDS